MKKKHTEKYTESQLREAIRESVRKVIEARERHILLGMPLPMGLYKRRIEDGLPEILISWCLVRYCTVSGRLLSKENWQEELRKTIENAAAYSIKGDDSADKRRKVFEEVWEDNDFEMPNVINLIVNERFYKEGIDTRSEEYSTTLIDCMANAQGILNAILSRNMEVIKRYVETI